MMQKILVVAVAIILLVVGIVALLEPLSAQPAQPAQPAQLAQDADEDLLHGLKPGEGRQLTLTYCALCHSATLVVSYRTTREGWDEVITRMQKEEGLWLFSIEDRTALLDYLEATQGPMDSEEPVRVTPWAEPLYKPNPIW